MAFESQNFEDEILEKVDKAKFVDELDVAKSKGVKLKLTLTAEHPSSGETIGAMTFEPKQFTFNRVAEKHVNENVSIWRFIHASLDKDDVKAVFEMQEFHDSLHTTVKALRLDKNQKIKGLRNKNDVAKLKNKLMELVKDEDAPAAGPSKPTGGLATVANAFGQAVGHAVGIGAKRQREN